MNTGRYIEIIRRKFISVLWRKLEVDKIYQQDGATQHCSNASLEYLHHYFPGDRLISSRHERTILGPHIPFGIHFCGERVCANNPKTVDALKNDIRTKIRRFPHEMLGWANTNFSVRATTVIQCQRAWIEHIRN